MGGAHTARGESLSAETARDAVIVDCAGDVPVGLREAARRFQHCVFLDVEERPPSWLRIRGMAAAIAEECRAAGGPTGLYVLCTHGMNRSGLVTGLFLRQFGVGAEESIALIRAARPGALSNETFVRLLLEG
jgi:protein-tyrosine phosphatase